MCGSIRVSNDSCGVLSRSLTGRLQTHVYVSGETLLSHQTRKRSMLKKEMRVGMHFTISMIRNKPLAKYGCVTGERKSKREEEEETVRSVDVAKGDWKG